MFFLLYTSEVFHATSQPFLTLQLVSVIYSIKYYMSTLFKFMDTEMFSFYLERTNHAQKRARVYLFSESVLSHFLIFFP